MTTTTMLRTLLVAGVAGVAGGALPGCEYELRSTVLLEVSNEMPVSADGQHYEIWVDVAGGSSRLACVRLEQRATDCAYGSISQDTQMFELTESVAVVECECPCEAREANPCIDELAARNIPYEDDGRQYTVGRVAGTTAFLGAGLVFGGSELITTRDLSSTTRMFIVRKDAAAPADQPGRDLLMSGSVVPDGAVLRGPLEAQSVEGADGYVTIVPVGDDATW